MLVKILSHSDDGSRKCFSRSSWTFSCSWMRHNIFSRATRSPSTLYQRTQAYLMWVGTWKITSSNRTLIHNVQIKQWGTIGLCSSAYVTGDAIMSVSMVDTSLSTVRIKIMYIHKLSRRCRWTIYKPENYVVIFNLTKKNNAVMQ